MNLVFEKLSQILAAGYKWDIGIAGTYFRLSGCQWPCTVMLLKGGQVIGSMANMLAGDYVDGVAFDSVSVINGTTGQAIDVQISGGGAGSNRVLGEVSVIDGGKSRVQADLAKCGYANINPGAGNYAHVQLWNPAGSQKNCYVEQLSTWAAAMPFGFGINSYAVALSTLLGNPKSKKLGGVNSVMELRGQASAAYLAGTNPMFVTTLSSPIFKPAEPVMVPPGNGLMIYGVDLNSAMGASFEYFEEVI